MDSRAPAVVAVVVTTGPGPGLEATLASLVAQEYEELSILVVANGDFDDVPNRVAAVAPSAFVKMLDDNRGYGGPVMKVPWRSRARLFSSFVTTTFGSILEP